MHLIRKIVLLELEESMEMTNILLIKKEVIQHHKNENKMLQIL